jgi:hypothetical protein
VLEHEAHAALAHVAHRRVLALEQHLATVGPLEAGDDAQQAGLARARGADERDELAGPPNGRSISVTSAFLPGKSNFATAQAAATPNSRFSGTATLAVTSVSFRAESAIGSRSAET